MKDSITEQTREAKIQHLHSLMDGVLPTDEFMIEDLANANPESTEDSAEVKLEQERSKWTEAENRWISLSEELRAEVEANRSLAKKRKHVLSREKAVSRSDERLQYFGSYERNDVSYNWETKQTCYYGAHKNVDDLDHAVHSEYSDKEIEGQADQSSGSCHNQVSLDDTPTLAFPSISTPDFQFNHDKEASYLNYASRVSIPSYKSPKGTAGFPLPGHESFPENNSSIKMVEDAMQRLTNLCPVLNDMEPIYVLNHVFVLREYMREYVLGNFRRRLA
ncbi:hypothetical protein KIW84_063952 [Lathyrus oleraceus]|uniref:Uncharacterized protein n=1 Tax=Pisum sativum TaxID=3888 RepID=A0A9D4WCZ8_PEA|nr:hypothetical protein KIW84_063952 [Pisum sativum]